MSDLAHEGRLAVEADLLEKAFRKCKHRSIPCSNKASRNLRPSREVGRELKIPSQKTTRKALNIQIKRNKLKAARYRNQYKASGQVTCPLLTLPRGQACRYLCPRPNDRKP